MLKVDQFAVYFPSRTEVCCLMVLILFCIHVVAGSIFKKNVTKKLCLLLFIFQSKFDFLAGHFDGIHS